MRIVACSVYASAPYTRRVIVESGPVLRTNRLDLYKPAAEDEGWIADLYRDENTLRYFPLTGDLATRASSMAKRALATWEANGFGPLIVVARSTGLRIGLAGLTVAMSIVNLGLTFVESARGSGFATKRARLLLTMPSTRWDCRKSARYSCPQTQHLAPSLRNSDLRMPNTF